MKINILHIGLNVFFDSKSDIIYGLFNALRSLGHETTIGHNLVERSALNLIVGSDLICGERSVLQNLFETNVDYAVFEVENFNGKTINYRKNFDLEGYRLLLEKSKFCLTPYRYNIRELKKLISGDLIFYSKWGYHDSMVNDQISRSSEFAHEALFYGLIKADRDEKVKRLNEAFKNKVKVITQEDPFTIRNYFISNSRFGLSLSYGEFDNFVNPFRLYHMVANGMPVLSDHTEDEDNYTYLCENSDFPTLVSNIDSFEPDLKAMKERCHSEKLASNLRPFF